MAESYTNTSADTSTDIPPQAASSPVLLIVSWLVVGLPLAWGIIETLKKSLALFH